MFCTVNQLYRNESGLCEGKHLIMLRLSIGVFVHKDCELFG